MSIPLKIIKIITHAHIRTPNTNTFDSDIQNHNPINISKFFCFVIKYIRVASFGVNHKQLVEYGRFHLKTTACYEMFEHLPLCVKSISAVTVERKEYKLLKWWTANSGSWIPLHRTTECCTNLCLFKFHGRVEPVAQTMKPYLCTLPKGGEMRIGIYGGSYFCPNCGCHFLNEREREREPNNKY